MTPGSPTDRKGTSSEQEIFQCKEAGTQEVQIKGPGQDLWDGRSVGQERYELMKVGNFEYMLKTRTATDLMEPCVRHGQR